MLVPHGYKHKHKKKEKLGVFYRLLESSDFSFFFLFNFENLNHQKYKNLNIKYTINLLFYNFS